MSALAVQLAAALPGAPLVSLVDARDVVQYLFVRLDVAAKVVLVVLLAGVLLDALDA